jgi:peptidoglycan/xylan/chitin deacetylase (PgdA/CDA1 family)
MAADAANNRTRPNGPVAFAARPHLAKRLLPNSLVRRRLPTGSGEVFLTFDDGPHPEHTPQVLDRLAAFGIRAGFFLIGRNVARSPRLVKRVAAAGHLIGNHSYHHRPRRREIAACQDEIERACDVRPAWYRPPFGRLTLPGLAAAWACGLRVMTWSLDANDWQCRTADDAAACAAAVVREARPGDVVLFHDGHRWIAPILDAALLGLRARGLV